jgi:hypothetical protein
MRRKSIRGKSASCGRLEDDRRLCCSEISDNGFTPASMMWQLYHVAREIDFAPRMHCGEPCSRLRLDVAREEDAERRICATTMPLDHDDKRKIVVAPRSEFRIGPEGSPAGSSDLHRIAACKLHDACRPRPQHREKFCDRGGS